MPRLVFIEFLERNKDSLSRISVPVSDADLPELLPVIKLCTGLKNFTCGSPQLTNESAPAIAEVLRVLPEVDSIGLRSQMDNDGFVKLESMLCNMAHRPKHLNLYWTRVGPALLSKILSPLANLKGLTLVGNPIGDDGFRQVAPSLRQLRRLSRLHFCDIGVTWRSLGELENILLSCPKVQNFHSTLKRNHFRHPAKTSPRFPA